jgi:Protein of unknown function (DUF2946)
MWRSGRQSLIIVIAAALLMAAAMAPTLSRLIQHALPQAAIMAAVCTMPGSDHGGSSTGDAAQGGQCQMCLVHGPALEPRPQAALVIHLPTLSDAMPSLFLWAPRPLFAWAAAQPRAPPYSA